MSVMTEIHDEVNIPDRIGVEAPDSLGVDEVAVPVIELSAGISATTVGDTLQDPTECEAFGSLSEEDGAAEVTPDIAGDDADLLGEVADQGDEQVEPVDRARLEIVAAFDQPANEPAIDGTGAGGTGHIVPPTGGSGGNENDGEASDGEDDRSEALDEVLDEGGINQVNEPDLSVVADARQKVQVTFDDPAPHLSTEDLNKAEEGPEDTGDNIHDGQERTGMVVEFGESEDNRTFHELSPDEQLNRFHERAAASGRATFNSVWIRDELRGVEVYIRDGSRPVRRVFDALGEVKIGDTSLALQGRCLEISDIKRVGNDPAAVNPETTPELFLQVMGVLAGYAESAGLWDAVGIDNLGDPAVSKWCTDNGWEEDPTLPEDLDTWLRPDFLYKPLPGRGVVGI